MIDCGDVVGLRQWLALGIGDRNHRHVGEDVIERLKLGQIEPTMQGRHERHAAPLQDGVADIVDVAVNDVELVGALRQLLEHHHVDGQRIAQRLVEAQRARPDDLALCRGRAVRRGEKRNVMAERHEFFGQVRDDALGTAVELRGHGFRQWRDLCDFHWSPVGSPPA